jgi:hypothetical protein
MKDVGLRIRVQRDLRERFLEACRAQDKPAAQVLREFMRSYVAAHGAGSDKRPDRGEGAAKESKLSGGKNAL